MPISTFVHAIPLPGWILGGIVAVLLALKASVIKSGADALWQKVRPDAPKLTVEIREVNLDQKVASLDTDFNGYTIDAYLFFDVWAVNKSQVVTTAKSWQLKGKGELKNLEAEFVRDMSKWHHVEKKKAMLNGLSVTTDIRSEINPFGFEPLKQGLPVQGWVCFLIRNVKPSLVESAKVELVLIDSFDRKSRVRAQGPWPEHHVVNPHIPW
jgi:hypothetical protein